MQTILHRRFDTQTLLQKHFHTQKLFAHRRFYTKKRLHTETGPVKSQVYLSFGDRNSFRAKGLRRTPTNRNFIPFFGDQTSFRVKGFAGRFANHNFTSVFGDRTSFRAKRLRREPGNHNFTSVFCDQTSFRAKGLHFVLSRWHCPRAFKREIEKKEKARGQERM